MGILQSQWIYNMKEENATLRAELATANETIGGLEQNAAAAHARITELEQQLAEANAWRAKLDGLAEMQDRLLVSLNAQLATAHARIAALEAERDREDIIIEVTIADRENMFICHVRGPVSVDQLLAINDDLFSNCDEQPFLGEPEEIAGVRLKAVWVRDGYDDGYWDFTTIARCTYSEEAGEVWTPSDAARAGKAGG